MNAAVLIAENSQRVAFASPAAQPLIKHASSTEDHAHQLWFGPFHFDSANQCLWRAGHRIDLAPKPFAVLCCLITHAGRLVTKEELLQTVWPDVCVTDAVLKVRIREVRALLGDNVRAPQFIETMHRRGYRFIANIRQASNFALAAVPVAAITNQETHRPNNASLLLGRGKVLAQLHHQLQLMLQNQRQCVFLTGAAGIGKSAVVDAFLAQANEQPNLLLMRGQCVDHYGQDEAYSPLLQALSRLRHQPGVDYLPDLLKRYAPNWLTLLPWLIEASHKAVPPLAVRPPSHARMLREMGELCMALARRAPLLLILENLHYSDYATLDVLAWLAKQREPAAVMVLVTYRPVELAARHHPLLDVKRELELHRQCTVYALDGLTSADVSDLLQQRYAEHAFPTELGAALHRRSGGNPLFLLTLLDHLLSEGMLARHDGCWRLTTALAAVEQLMPESLRQMIGNQLDQLSHEQQRLLASASFSSTDFTPALLATSLALNVAAIGVCCASLARQGQFLRSSGVVETDDGTLTERYEFVHGLYRDVVRSRQQSTICDQRQRALRDRKAVEHAGNVIETAAEPDVSLAPNQDFQQAINTLLEVGNIALPDSANRMAFEYLTRGLQLLAGFSETGQPVAPLQLLEERGYQRLTGMDS